MTQKIANILTTGMWKRPQRWWRSHPKFTIAFVLAEIAAMIAYLVYAEKRNNRIITGAYQDAMLQVEAEIAADPVGWYIKNGMTPYSHEEKEAFRQRYALYERYSDEAMNQLFGARKLTMPPC